MQLTELKLGNSVQSNKKFTYHSLKLYQEDLNRYVSNDQVFPFSDFHTDCFLERTFTKGAVMS